MFVKSPVEHLATLAHSIVGAVSWPCVCKESKHKEGDVCQHVWHKAKWTWLNMCNRFVTHLLIDWEISLISKVITHPRGLYMICKHNTCRHSPMAEHLQMRYKPNGHVTTALLYSVWADQSTLSCVCHEVNFILLVLCHKMVW